MAKTAAPKEIIKALALLAHAAQQEQAMHLGTARTRQEPRSTGQALRSSRGSRICWHTSIRYDRSDEGHDWTDAGPFRTWKSDKMHVGVPFAHLGCSPFGCVVQWGDTRARNLPELQAHARGKWGSATRGAKDRIVDVLAFASDLGWCAIAGFKWRLPLFGPRIRQNLFVNE